MNDSDHGHSYWNLESCLFYRYSSAHETHRVSAPISHYPLGPVSQTNKTVYDYIYKNYIYVWWWHSNLLTYSNFVSKYKVFKAL